jgi:hypothetical protein
VSWPFLAGVKLVPNTPSDETPAGSAAPAAPSTAPQTEKNEPGATLPAVQQTTAASVELEKSVVISCNDKEGRKQNHCDKPALDEKLSGHFKSLAACKPGTAGKISLGLKLDFSKNKIVDVVRGKSTTLDEGTAMDVLGCAQTDLQTVSLEGVDHLNEKYLIFYFLNLLPAGTPVAPAQATPTVTPASGNATVIFESAMVHESAEASSKVLTRLLYGTRVVVKGRVGDWYEVAFDSKGHKGFIHKNALGLK